MYRETYYQAIGQPLNVSVFISSLQQQMTDALTMLNKGIKNNSKVKILNKEIQKVLTEPGWNKKMTKEDLRGLTPLFWTHVNPYGTFRLDMNERLELDAA